MEMQYGTGQVDKRPSKVKRRSRRVIDVLAQVNWLAKYRARVEVEIQRDDGRTILLRMSADAARSLGTNLIDCGDKVILHRRRFRFVRKA